MSFSVPFLCALSVSVVGLAQQQASDPVTDISAIIVVRKGCFGGCPRYTLTLRRQGRSTYIGVTGLRRGLYTAPVSGRDFDQLTQAISESRFFDLPDVIGPVAEDVEQVVVTVTTAENMKTATIFDLAASPLSTVVALGDALAAKLPWENLNQPKDGILNPYPLRKVEPQYTEQARKARLQGSVIIRVEVRPDGTVAPDSITVVQGLGPELDENAIEAVKQWIFKPAYRNGKPIGTPMPVNVQVEFRL